MIGGTSAIVFAISIFLLQNTSDLYSSQYHEAYIHDWNEKTVFVTVIGITVVLLGAGLFVGGQDEIAESLVSSVVLGSLVLIGTAFALIDCYWPD